MHVDGAQSACDGSYLQLNKQVCFEALWACRHTPCMCMYTSALFSADHLFHGLMACTTKLDDNFCLTGTRLLILQSALYAWLFPPTMRHKHTMSRSTLLLVCPDLPCAPLPCPALPWPVFALLASCWHSPVVRCAIIFDLPCATLFVPCPVQSTPLGHPTLLCSPSSACALPYCIASALYNSFCLA